MSFFDGDLHGDVYGDVDEVMMPRNIDENPALREKRLREENVTLKGQLVSAREIIKGVARGGVAVDGGHKRPRLGAGGVHGEEAVVSGDNARHHPATIRAEKLKLELQEQKVLREQDRQRFTLALGEVESAKGKLLRQVKFLSQEEEETRAECKKKQEAFLSETAKLQEALGDERAALAEARAENGQMGQQARQALERRLKRAVSSERVAAETRGLLEEQVKARSEEVKGLRKQRREGEAENARLSREVAALRRNIEAGAVTSDSTSTAASATGVPREEGAAASWDTPAARELRGRIKMLEREAWKKDATLQELQDDQRNAIALEDRIENLEAKLKRAEASLKSALEAEAECAAIKDEKEEWSLVFSRALGEETMLARFKRMGKAGGNNAAAVVGEGGGDGDGGGKEVFPRPTPLVALRLLRESQDERSTCVKELTTIRMRHDTNKERLCQVEQNFKQEKERADTLQARSEDLRSEIDALERRCRSAEWEVTAQKELIKSYEKDNFRKPAGEAWMSDHAALQGALAAAKDEAKALREAAGGQVSTTEAARIRARAAEAEAALEAAVKDRDKAITMAEEYAKKMAAFEKGAASGTGLLSGKAFHLRDNPVASAANAVKVALKTQVEALREDNKRLVRQLESVGAGSVDASISMDGVSVLGGSGMKAADTPDAKKFSVRLKEIYKEKINYYREAVYLLTGYRVDLPASKDPARPLLRLRSMYAEHESDCLLFQQGEHGLELVETPLALQHMDKIEIFMGQCDSIPAFLSSLTNDLFEKQTRVIPR